MVLGHGIVIVDIVLGHDLGISLVVRGVVAYCRNGRLDVADTSLCRSVLVSDIVFVIVDGWNGNCRNVVESNVEMAVGNAKVVVVVRSYQVLNCGSVVGVSTVIGVVVVMNNVVVMVVGVVRNNGVVMVVDVVMNNAAVMMLDVVMCNAVVMVLDVVMCNAVVICNHVVVV